MHSWCMSLLGLRSRERGGRSGTPRSLSLDVRSTSRLAMGQPSWKLGSCPCGPVAQWQSSGLLIHRSEVRSLPGLPPHVPPLVAERRGSGVQPWGPSGETAGLGVSGDLFGPDTDRIVPTLAGWIVGDLGLRSNPSLTITVAP